MKEVYKELLDNIPDYKTFLTVDEMDESSKRLATLYPESVEIFEMGKTRKNHLLYGLKIGSGRQNALVFGCPHPNEPIGSMMLEYFTEALASNSTLREELDYTWYIVKVWDVDGTKLNENWFKGPFTIKNYARNFFRPASFKQVDWTFPVDYKELHFHDTIPETRAMMKLIDEIKPKFIYSLHNGGFCGVYWYITSPTPEIYEDLHQIAIRNGVPLDFGEPERPAGVSFSPAIYAEGGISTEYDYIEKYVGEDIKELIKKIRWGDCSSSYAKQRHNSFTLVTELPYFYNPQIGDYSDSDMTRRAAIIDMTETHEHTQKEISNLMSISRRHISPNNPFVLAIESFIETDSNINNVTKKIILKNPEYAKPATVAEKFGCLMMSRFYDSLLYGLLVRANEIVLQKMDKVGEVNPDKRTDLKRGFQETLIAFERVTDFLEENMNYQVVPIKTLVGIQLESGLILAEYLKKHP